MTRLYLRFATLPILLFTAVFLLLRIQPYNDLGLRHLLTPTDCPASCFLGIRPEETTVKEALERLRSSQWISGIDNRVIDNTYGYINWAWTSDKPDWIRANTRGEIAAYEGRVRTIVLYTNFQLGDTQLTFGLPNSEGFNPVSRQNRKYILYFRFYQPRGFVVMSWQPCEMTEPFKQSVNICLLYTSPSPRDQRGSRMPSSA